MHAARSRADRRARRRSPRRSARASTTPGRAASIRCRCAPSRSTPAPGRTCSTSLPLPDAFSYSQFVDLRGLPAAVRVPAASTGSRRAGRSPRSPSGSRAHAAFEAFTKEQAASASRGASRPRAARISSACSRREWPAGQFGDQTTEETYERRVGTLLDNFYDGELTSVGRGAPRGAGRSS